MHIVDDWRKIGISALVLGSVFVIIVLILSAHLKRKSVQQGSKSTANSQLKDHITLSPPEPSARIYTLPASNNRAQQQSDGCNGCDNAAFPSSNDYHYEIPCDKKPDEQDPIYSQI